VNPVHGACAATNHGQSCTNRPTLTDPVMLCDEHKVQVAALVAPEILSSALAQVRAANDDGTSPVSEAGAHMVASAQSTGLPESDRHGALVYFVANGGRVKIGFTKRLVSRLRALSLSQDAVLLLLQGGEPLERALHAKFGRSRIGSSEWFELTPEIVRFIATKGPKSSRLTSGNRRGELFLDKPHRTRRAMTEWVALTTPVFHAEFERLKRQPTAHEFAEAIKKAGHGAVSASTAKNVRTEILDRSPLPSLD
jgi:T5orf172 domain